MKFILVVDRKHLFPGLTPRGFLPLESIDLPAIEQHAFFAERDFMEECSHYKQIIPYMALRLDDEILCYQRKVAHSEARLGGLWTIGFGGHIEPIDRDGAQARELGLLKTSALRELHEETGLEVNPNALQPLGFINSEATEVSSVHFGVFFRVDLGEYGLSATAIADCVTRQTEPHQVAWRKLSEIAPGNEQIGAAPENGQWEDWTQLALLGVD